MRVLLLLLCLLYPTEASGDHRLTYDFSSDGRAGITLELPGENWVHTIGFATTEEDHEEFMRFRYALFTESCWQVKNDHKYASYGFYTGVGLMLRSHVDINTEDILNRKVHYPTRVRFKTRPFITGAAFVTVWVFHVSAKSQVLWGKRFHTVSIGGSF